ncbi:MAG: hypothetical protein HC801_10475, partial [Nitrospira sp.]|nr:hypothetical protein [Nitrospira sp.]
MKAGKHNRVATELYKATDKAARLEARSTVSLPYFRGSWTDSCDRKIYYLRTGQRPLPFYPDVFEKMKKGESLHTHIRSWIDQTGKFRVDHQEEELEATWPVVLNGHEVHVTIRGHIDGILKKKVRDTW